MSNEQFVDLSGIDLNDRFEPGVYPQGKEAQLRIVSFMKDIDKNGDEFIMPFFEVIEDPYCKEFGDYIPLPSDKFSPKKNNESKNKIIALSTAFDIDFSTTIDIKNDIVGKTGWAILGIGKDQDDSPVNRIKKYVVGA
uniref:Uncharacterized protein n=1 Tax=viral metagenome TaxID=1070528 RepID=A0A6M3LP08_9ZZZZ